mmetsp:Transcript_40259/g.82402  ORF Transcript_40259/g.82402 Transcript_40259/m.82402 type:complete len:303 (-) Transcript_40259:273-1181(-)
MRYWPQRSVEGAGSDRADACLVCDFCEGEAQRAYVFSLCVEEDADAESPATQGELKAPLQQQVEDILHFHQPKMIHPFLRRQGGRSLGDGLDLHGRHCHRSGTHAVFLRAGGEADADKVGGVSHRHAVAQRPRAVSYHLNSRLAVRRYHPDIEACHGFEGLEEDREQNRVRSAASIKPARTGHELPRVAFGGHGADVVPLGAVCPEPIPVMLFHVACHWQDVLVHVQQTHPVHRVDPLVGATGDKGRPDAPPLEWHRAERLCEVQAQQRPYFSTPVGDDLEVDDGAVGPVHVAQRHHPHVAL